MFDRFDRETLLDLVVNAVPLGMLAVFIALFLLASPYGIDPGATAIQFTLVIVPFGALLVLTYYSAKAIERAESQLEADPESFAEPEGAAANPDPDADYADLVEEESDDEAKDPEATEPSVGAED